MAVRKWRENRLEEEGEGRVGLGRRGRDEAFDGRIGLVGRVGQKGRWDGWEKGREESTRGAPEKVAWRRITTQERERNEEEERRIWSRGQRESHAQARKNVWRRVEQYEWMVGEEIGDLAMYSMI